MSRFRSLLVVVVLFLLTGTCGAVEKTYYSFELDGKSIGYAEVEVDDVTWDGQQLRRLRSVTTLKFALLGTTHNTVRRSTTLVDPKTGSPVYFELTQEVNDATSHVESKFGDKQVQTWRWDGGASKGQPQETVLQPDTRILGNNNFAHWNLLTKAATSAATDGPAEFTVYLPDTGTIEKFRLVRGDKKELTVRGVSRACQIWQLQDAGIDLSVDAQDGQLLKMDIPAQKTTVLLADQGVVQATEQEGAQEILAQHFAQSNVAFDDFLKVRMLRAKIDVSVIGEGITNEQSVLNTAMQKFEGEKETDAITGTVTITSQPFTPQEAIPWPATEPATPDLKQWLEPEHLIESDDTKIVALAKELTQDTHERWAAVLKIAGWVHKEIRYTIADSPSARMALEKRTGDCGPHATLTVALLRAVGIPAKLVGGVIFTPSFGGSFGQHAWVEVDMGKDGWVAFDPTTGELDVLSAVHIKLFEGMGGVIPRKIEVLEYQPPNREVADTTLAQGKPIPWKLDQDYTYTYVQNAVKLGTEVFRVAKAELDGQEYRTVTDTLDLTAQGTHIQSTTQMMVQPNVLPRSFQRVHEDRGTKVTQECTFQNDAVKVKITGPTEMEREISLKPGIYCFDNNLISSFALICSQFDLQENSKVELRTFHPSSMSVIALTFQLKQIKKIPVAEQEVECFECFVEPIKNTFWITRDGRLVKVEARELAIELSPLDRAVAEPAVAEPAKGPQPQQPEYAIHTSEAWAASAT